MAEDPMLGRFRNFSTAQRYLAALACVAGAAALRRFLTPLIGTGYPYLFQLLAVLASGRFFGFGPAVAGLVLGSSPLFLGIDFISPVPDRTGSAFWIRMTIAYSLTIFVISLLDRQRRMSGEMETAARIAGERLEQLGIEIEQREREQALSAQLRAIVESSDDAIIAKGLDSVIRSWNYGAEQIFGYAAAEAIGRTTEFLVPPDRRHEESDMIERIRHGGRVRHFETIRLRKDGTPIHVSLTMSPIQDPRGQIVGVSHISREITERKQLEEQILQTQKLESLGVLAGGLAHDFNNLLTSIMGNASLASHALAQEHPSRGYLTEVLAACERAALLVRQMLAYAGKGRSVIAHVNLSTQVAEIVSLIRSSMARNVQLNLQLADTLPPVAADRAQLQQVIMNLAINGAEAMVAEPGVLTISTFARQTESEQQVVLQVRDTGCGMDDVTRARIFDPFYTTKFTGRGLGLSAVIGIVRAHLGFIAVESEPGRGSTFTIVLPAAVADVEAEPRGYGQLLVIGGEEIGREMARFTLERRGYTVKTAADGASALTLLTARENHFDAILLELATPVSTAEETLEQLQSLRPGVRVVVSSTLSDSEALKRFGHRGVAGFLQTPYTAAVLARKVKQALQRDLSARA